MGLGSRLTLAVAALASTSLAGCIYRWPLGGMQGVHGAPPSPPPGQNDFGAADYGRKPGAVARLPADDPFPPPYAWPEEFAAAGRRPTLGVSGGVFFFGGDLHLDAAAYVAPRVTVPLGNGWDLELPVKIACPTAGAGTGPITNPRPVQIQPPVNPTNQTTSKRGEVICAELGLVRHWDIRDYGRWSVSGSLGAGAGITWFTDFGVPDDTALSAHVSAAVEFRSGDRFKLFVEGQLHGFYTDFHNAGDRTLEPGFALGLGASWDL